MISHVDTGDGLERYIAMANETLETLSKSDHPLVKALFEFDAFFRGELWEHCDPRSTYSFLLYLNAYQMSLAAAREGLSGHPVAVFPLLRTALESASYGYLIDQQPEMAAVWGERHKSEDHKKACRNLFTFDKAIRGLNEKSPDLHRLAREVYEGAIDYGAHPNMKSVFLHVSIDDQRDDGMTAVTHTSLYDADHPATWQGLCACLDFGYVIIGIILLSGPAVDEKQIHSLARLNSIKEAAIKACQDEASVDK